MTKTQILAQLADLVDGYVDLSESEGTDTTTWDFIVASYFGLDEQVGSDSAQATIDEVSPTSIVQYEAGESTDQDEVVITIGDDVEIIDGEHADKFGTVVGFQIGVNITNVIVDLFDDPDTTRTVVGLADVVVG